MPGKTTAIINAWIDDAATLVWNGPLGAFEIPPFDKSNGSRRETRSLTQESQQAEIDRRGGDTLAALNHAGAGDGFSYVSTAGGAFLEWMEGKPPIAVTVILDLAAADK